MPNRTHLEIARTGSSAIRDWDNQHQFEGLDLSGADLSGLDLSWARLSGANLSSAKLIKADLSNARLDEANLTGANLTDANLWEALLFLCNLSGANLTNATLVHGNLVEADLTGATLTQARLDGANLLGADLAGANLDHCRMGYTALTGTHLPQVGLETIDHIGPSAIDHATLEVSGMLPVEFLRGCGLPDHLIRHYQDIYDKPAPRFSCFISYSTVDQSLADQLHADLDRRGVRNWLATEDLKIGDRHRQEIEDQIRLHDKLLLILSTHSVASRWVEREVLAALDREERTGTAVLFPITIDSAVFESPVQWAAEIQRGRHIGDFTGWDTSAERYETALARVLRDLQPSEA